MSQENKSSIPTPEEFYRKSFDDLNARETAAAERKVVLYEEIKAAGLIGYGDKIKDDSAARECARSERTTLRKVRGGLYAAGVASAYATFLTFLYEAPVPKHVAEVRSKQHYVQSLEQDLQNIPCKYGPDNKLNLEDYVDTLNQRVKYTTKSHDEKQDELVAMMSSSKYVAEKAEYDAKVQSVRNFKGGMVDATALLFAGGFIVSLADDEKRKKTGESYAEKVNEYKSLVVELDAVIAQKVSLDKEQADVRKLHERALENPNIHIGDAVVNIYDVPQYLRTTTQALDEKKFDNLTGQIVNKYGASLFVEALRQECGLTVFQKLNKSSNNGQYLESYVRNTLADALEKRLGAKPTTQI